MFNFSLYKSIFYYYNCHCKHAQLTTTHSNSMSHKFIITKQKQLSHSTHSHSLSLRTVPYIASHNAPLNMHRIEYKYTEIVVRLLLSYGSNRLIALINNG